MEVKSITKYKVNKAFSLFDMLFMPGTILYISSSFRKDGMAIDWMHTFDENQKLLGNMNREYFYKLDNNYIESVPM